MDFIYDKYQIEEMYFQLVEEIIKAIYEEYTVDEVINEFEEEDYEDFLSSLIMING